MLRHHLSSLLHAPWVKAGLTAALLVAGALSGPGPARAGEDPFPLACANRDLDLVILIEIQGEAQIIAPAKLADAYLSVLNARALCTAGKVDEAVALYTTAFRALYEESLFQQNKVAGR